MSWRRQQQRSRLLVHCSSNSCSSNRSAFANSTHTNSPIADARAPVCVRVLYRLHSMLYSVCCGFVEAVTSAALNSRVFLVPNGACVQE